MKPSELLLDRLRREGVNIPPGARIVSTKAGYRQREQGAPAWYVVDAIGQEVRISSTETIGGCLRSPTLRWGGPLWRGAGYIDIGVS